jgi:hypothetical protein
MNARTRLINSSGAISSDPRVALDGREAPVTGRWELNDEQWAVVEPMLRPRQLPNDESRPETPHGEIHLLARLLSLGHPALTPDPLYSARTIRN